MKLKTVSFALSGLLLIGGLAWHHTHRAAARHNAAPATPGQRVQTQPIRVRDVPVLIDALGTVTPLHTVVVRAQVSGTLRALHFTEGQAVHQGDVLATLDDRALQAQVLAQQGATRRDEALLSNARADLARDQALLRVGTVTQQQVDTQQALVHQYEGTLLSDHGSLQNLQVQLGYTRVVAPISGVAGLRAVDSGNLVQPGDTAGIVTLTSTQPTSVKFAIPEDDLDRVLSARHAAPLRVQAWTRDNSTLLASGQLDAIDNRVDASTGTVMLRAGFANTQNHLFPAQFVNVRLQINTLEHALLVPTRAIQHGAQGDYLYVAKDGKAWQHRLLPGPVDGDDTVLQEVAGTPPAQRLSAQDQVITDGADTLDQGSVIQTGKPHA